MALTFWQQWVPGGRGWDGETVRGQANWDISIPPAIVSPQPERNTKNVLWRAVDVNRPVTLWCVPDAVRATRARAATGGFTSPVRLVTWGPVRKTTSDVLHTVSLSRHRRLRESQRHGPPCGGPADRTATILVRPDTSASQTPTPGGSVRDTGASRRLWGTSDCDGSTAGADRLPMPGFHGHSMDFCG